MPKISIIVPVYNVERYICKCIDSILSQTFTDFEIILVDDGSPDNCGNICDEYAKSDNRISVIHRENGGLSVARNTGINWAFQHSDSEFLTFVDSDDTIAENYLEKLTASMDDSTDIVSCKLNFFIEETQKSETDGFFNTTPEQFTGKEAVVHLYKTNGKVRTEACAKLYRKHLFSNIRFPEGKIHEDQFIIPILLYNSRNVVAIDDPLYTYYIRKGSITHGNFSAKRFDDIEALQSCEDYFKEKNEQEISELVKHKKQLFHALYIINARKSGVYKTVPKKYKMSILKALRTLEKSMSFNRFTWRLNQFYPKLVKPYSYWVQLLKKLHLYSDIPD